MTIPELISAMQAHHAERHDSRCLDVLGRAIDDRVRVFFDARPIAGALGYMPSAVTSEGVASTPERTAAFADADGIIKALLDVPFDTLPLSAFLFALSLSRWCGGYDKPYTLFLPSRAALVARIEAHLVATRPDKVEALLKGLR